MQSARQHSTEMYQKVAHNTATPQNLMLLGTRRVRALLDASRQAVEAGDTIAKAKSLSRALDIVIYWQTMLPETGELRDALNSQYDFLKTHITSANAGAEGEVHSIDEALAVVDHLQQFWSGQN